MQVKMTRREELEEKIVRLADVIEDMAYRVQCDMREYEYALDMMEEAELELDLITHKAGA